ncbi:hypothetical protein HWV62_35738 [Athelia sp. TMB]|nr:hypothetical protein HWV62_35738 [Athelia sp. TMB]
MSNMACASGAPASSFAASQKSDLYITPSDDGEGKRLRQYVDLIGQLSHPNVGGTLGLPCAHGSIFGVVLPLYPGGNVLQYLEGHPVTTDAERMDIVIDFLRGLEYLHGKNMTHDNVRADNVLIDGTNRALLCDAQYKTMVTDKEDAPYAHLTSSCRWTSPEQLFSEDLEDTRARAGEAADVWAAALTIMQASKAYHRCASYLTSLLHLLDVDPAAAIRTYPQGSQCRRDAEGVR